MNEATRAPIHKSTVGHVLAAALTLASALAVAAPAAAVELVAEAAVRERANQRWEAMVAGKFEDAYQYLSPGFRAVQSYKNYSSRLANTAWNSGKAVRVECNDERDKCVATIKIDSKVFMPGMKLVDKLGSNLTTFDEESWIRQDGVWWLFPQS